MNKPGFDEEVSAAPAIPPALPKRPTRARTRRSLLRPGILRIPDAEAATGYGRSSLYRLEAEGNFPRRVKLGLGRNGAVGWRTADIEAWLEERAAQAQVKWGRLCES